jgi:hypothetical protein
MQLPTFAAMTQASTVVERGAIGLSHVLHVGWAKERWEGNQEDHGMTFPTIDLKDKKVILLSGFLKHQGGRDITVVAKDKLEDAAKRYHDAIAFGFVFGKWRPAA